MRPPRSPRPSLRVLALILWCGLVPVGASAATPSVPKPLEPWVDWVLQARPEAGCTWLDEGRQCLWSPELSLTLDAEGGRFEQRWTVESARPVFVPLPRAEQAEPFDVRLDGRPAVVVGTPRRGVMLPAGTHRVSGRLAWQALPDHLDVPEQTAVIRGTVAGRPLPPHTPGAKELPLQAGPAEAEGADRLEVAVFRRVSDGVPVTVEVKVALRVSGGPRVEQLRGLLLPGTRLVDFESPIPVRPLDDGSLEVEVQPGTWWLGLVSRHTERSPTLTLPEEAEAAEVWVFAPDPALRQVEVTGPPTVDPAQTRLPEAWRSLTAYAMAPGAQFALTPKDDGRAGGRDALRLDRELWLDFDGAGLTAVDHIRGTLATQSRLDAAARLDLGRVHFPDAAADRLITLGTNGARGVELRQEEVNLEAQGRYHAPDEPFAASGWQHTFESAEAWLQLPPGWTLFHVSGVDQAGTWLAQWNVLEAFLALILALSFQRLWGWRWGLLALAGFVLLLPESDAPRWIWVAVLGLEALRRILSEGWIGRLVGAARALALLGLAALSVAYAGGKVQVALHPVLAGDLRGPWGPHTAVEEAMEVAVAEAPREQPSGAVFDQGGLGTGINAQGTADRGMGGLGYSGGSRPEMKQLKREGLLEALEADSLGSGAPPSRWRSTEPDPSVAVQTGPGQPAWAGSRHHLVWTGPLAPTQSLRLWLWAPWLTGLVGLLSVLLLALLVGRALWTGVWPRLPFGRAAALALLGVAAMGPHAAHAEIPPGEILIELGNRLTAAPACQPHCVGLQDVQVSADQDILRITLDLHLAEAVGAPLPSVEGWRPVRVTADGRPANRVVSQKGRVWIALEAGRHRVVLEGPVGDRRNLDVDLALPPARRALALSSGWRLESHKAAALRLVRVAESPRERGSNYEVNAPPAIQVTRVLTLEKTWTVTTVVTRTSRPTGLLSVRVPLLPGEAPMTKETLEDGAVVVAFAPGEAGPTYWTSVLPVQEELTLTAPDRDGWAERWRLEASPDWQVTATGGSPVRASDGPAPPVFRPWPGESVTLSVHHPEGAPGRHLTVDAARLSVRPGRRNYDATLSMTLRASRGLTHPLRLPEGAVLQELTRDGRAVESKLDGRRLDLPVTPGAATWEVSWRADQPISPLWRVPEVDLGVPAVNLTVEVAPSVGRWLLGVTSPGVGPVVRLWALLLVVLGLGALLARTGVTPLSLADWLLLGFGVLAGGLWPAFLVAGWLLALGWRARSPELAPWAFNARQLGLVLLTPIALGALVGTVGNGLLDEPSMYVDGLGSSAHRLLWFLDRSPGALPSPLMVSLPMWVWRGAMLLWALWLAVRVLGWLRWALDAFRLGGAWRSVSLPSRRKVPVAKPVAPKTP